MGVIDPTYNLGLPHDIYMTFYISNISRRRNNNNVKYK